MNDCWRCGYKGDVLVHDPMMLNLRDGIYICRQCVRERIAVVKRYVKSGLNLAIEFEVGNT